MRASDRTTRGDAVPCTGVLLSGRCPPSSQRLHSLTADSVAGRQRRDLCDRECHSPRLRIVSSRPETGCGGEPRESPPCCTSPKKRAPPRSMTAHPTPLGEGFGVTDPWGRNRAESQSRMVSALGVHQLLPERYRPRPTGAIGNYFPSSVWRRRQPIHAATGDATPLPHCLYRALSLNA